MAAEVVGVTEFTDLVNDRVQADDNGLTKTQVRTVIKAMQAEVADCIAQGYGVNVAGIVKLTPVYVPAKPRRKGRNPFDPDAGEQWLKAQPAKVRVKASALAKAKADLPKSLNSKQGKQLAKQLAG